MANVNFTVEVRTEIIPHTAGDDAVHAEECFHLRAHFPGTKYRPVDEWLCVEFCPLRRSLELSGAIYKRPADKAPRLFERLRGGEPI